MTASHFKIALFAIALSPFILNAELRDDLYDDEDVAYSDDREDENDDGLYYDDDDVADASYSDDSYSQKQNSDTACHSPFHRMHFGARHTEARGVGYRDGYTTLEGFGIYDHNPNFMPFLDLRAHVFNNGKLAGNVGIGERTVLSSINHIIGGYLYYDVRQENHSFTINQLSPGFELLGKRMEYRINGYFPVGGHRSYKYGYKFNKFHDNNILLHNKQKVALKGGDAEVGVHITQSTKYDLYAGAGPYYFGATRAHSWGGKVRLIGRYKEYVSLEASYSYDRMFRNVVQGTVGLNYPFGPKLKRKDQNCPQQNDLMLSRAAFAPYRFEIPVVKRVTQTSKAINPATGKPWQVWFVNNTSSSSGTFQSPFPTLLQAENASAPNDMIYVFPGDGTTTGMNMGITLQDGQKLLGSSVNHKISTTKGNVTISTFSRNAPTITNTASVVTLANGNEVSGMNIAVTTVGINAIDGTSGINGVTIDRNVISGSVNYSGINIVAEGKIVTSNNQLLSPSSNLSSANGIDVTILNGASAGATIYNNTILGYATGITFSSDVSLSAKALISENNISNFSSFGIVSGGTSNTTVQIKENNIQSSSLVGTIIIPILVGFNTTPNSGKYFIQNNNLSATPTTITAFGISLLASNTASAQAFISNNNILIGPKSGNVGIQIATATNSTLCTSITNNNIALQAPSVTKGMSIAAPSGSINIDDFSGNIAPSTSISGNVNFVASGTCGQ